MLKVSAAPPEPKKVTFALPPLYAAINVWKEVTLARSMGIVSVEATPSEPISVKSCPDASEDNRKVVPLVVRFAPATALGEV